MNNQNLRQLLFLLSFSSSTTVVFLNMREYLCVLYSTAPTTKYFMWGLQHLSAAHFTALPAACAHGEDLKNMPIADYHQRPPLYQYNVMMHNTLIRQSTRHHCMKARMTRIYTWVYSSYFFSLASDFVTKLANKLPTSNCFDATSAILSSSRRLRLVAYSETRRKGHETIT